MTSFKRIFSICALLLLAACGGGGGDAGAPPFSGGGGSGGGGTTPPPPAIPAAADLVLALSASSITTSGNASVTATATALDANRNTLAGVPVTLSVNSGAVISPSGTVTAENGSITGTIGIGSDTSPRTITVTATSGSITRTASLSAITGTPVVPTAADLTLVLSSPSLANSGTATVTATATAVDVNRNVIAGIPVTLSVDSDAIVSVAGTATNASGVVNGVISIGANKANRPVRVTAISGTLTREVVLEITGTRIFSTALPTVISSGQLGEIEYRVVDAGNQLIPSFPVRVVGAGGVVTEGRTDAQGAYTYRYTAPAGNQTLSIVATSGGVEATQTILVQGTIVPVDPILNPEVSASIAANPSVVAFNPTQFTTNNSEIRFLFVTAGNRPVENIRVRFDLTGDPNSVGGTLSTGNTLVYTNAAGIARSNFRPGNRFSPTNGVLVRACWSYVDFPAGTCPNSQITTLTVIDDPLAVTIGTDSLVVIGDLVYSQRYVVQVNDSSGLAKADVLVNPVLDLPSYRQGFWTRTTERWVKTETAINCENEDVNRNGLLEVYTNGDREDANSNGQLDPRKSDVVVSYEGSNRTDASGRVTFRITYPQNIGSWLDYQITVAATGVAGTEGRASYAGTLLVPISAVTAEAEPAFRFSPYGQDVNPPRNTVSVPTDPPGNQRTASLCARP